MEITELDLCEVAAGIRHGRFSSEDVTRAALARIERYDPAINAFIAVEPERALAAARGADAALANGGELGALHGVPLAHKDMFDRVGTVASFGAPPAAPPDARAPAAATATVLKRLEAAGAITLGRLNMSEFAANPTGLNAFGDCHNPWAADRISGGSSSGSAAAVAAGFVYGALGSDTGGSIRLPAAFCGVVGLKPTYGRVSRAGAMPRAWSLDTVGPLGRTVRDCARLLGVIAGIDAHDSSASAAPVPDFEAGLSGSLRGLRIGVDDGLQTGNADIDEPIARCLRVLQDLGAAIVPVRLPDLGPHYLLAEVINKCEAATLHGRRMQATPDHYAEETRRRIEAGFHIPATRYLEALSVRGRMLEEFVARVLADTDAFLGAVSAMPAPRFADARLGDGGAFAERLARFTQFNRPINYLGLPALAVPCGFTADELPVAFQIVGRPFAEPILFRVGHAYQEATGWHRRRPKLPDPVVDRHLA